MCGNSGRKKGLSAVQREQRKLEATQIDVEPIVRMVRVGGGGAIDPITVYRVSGYRKWQANARTAERTGHSGIV
ncbi:MAG: hypothetical protein QF565_02605 [Arenicellales bacterium]|jgi:L-rhamnose isomerase/sugar isomerase|nr:hypothetical protein [Arenicellales bacterium]HJO18188.1 hypothetical protein [Vicinamibacterales bacterium]